MGRGDFFSSARTGPSADRLDARGCIMAL